MTLDDKINKLAEDFGLDLVLMQNDLEHFDVIKFLVLNGHIDLEDYFYKDTDEEILQNED